MTERDPHLMLRTIRDQMGQRLPLPGALSPVGWELPAELSEEQWRSFASLLDQVERGHQWWIGDWWDYGERRYGDRKALTESPAWDGPKFQTCANTASVARQFETSRRREVLSFTHHAEVAGLPVAEADALLDRAVAEKLSTRELRDEVRRRCNGSYPVVAGPDGGCCGFDELHKLVVAGVRFGNIYVDPPWLYDNQATKAATSNHYRGLTVDQLCDPKLMPVAELAAADAHLHLWTTNSFLFECPRIFEAWGFEFKSSFVWVKPEIGIGNYWRCAHEMLLTGVRGAAKHFDDHNLKSWLECSRGGHSHKPDQVRDFIARASPTPRLELFARSEHDGWLSWGDQIQRDLCRAEDLGVWKR